MPEARAIDVAPRPSTAHQGVPGAAARSETDNLAARVNENGCFESDHVIKSGYVERRTHKTRKWKTAFIVLRLSTLSVYKNEKETKLRHQLCLSDLTAAAFLKDPKHKRHNVFGLFSPSKNFHFQAPTAQDAQEWIELIRKDARFDDGGGDTFIASPLARSMSSGGLMAVGTSRSRRDPRGGDDDHVLLSSSSELNAPRGPFAAAGQRESFYADWSGNELASHSDLSDHEGPRPLGALESLANQPAAAVSHPLVHRSASQVSALKDGGQSNGHAEADPDRVAWHGWLWMLRSKGGVRQWKKAWAVLRPRNLILYKDKSEYAVQWLVQLSAVVSVVDIDPLSKSKQHCLQIITEEKSYRFCARDEEALVQFLGTFKSLLAKRHGVETRRAPQATTSS